MRPPTTLARARPIPFVATLLSMWSASTPGFVFVCGFFFVQTPEIERLETELAASETERTQAAAAVEAAKERVASLEAELEAARSEATAGAEHVAALTRATEATEAAQAEAAALRERIKDLEENALLLDAAKTECARLEAEVTALQGRVAELEAGAATAIGTHVSLPFDYCRDMPWVSAPTNHHFVQRRPESHAAAVAEATSLRAEAEARQEVEAQLQTELAASQAAAAEATAALAALRASHEELAETTGMAGVVISLFLTSSFFTGD